MTSVFVMTFDSVEGDAAEAYDRVIDDMALDGKLPQGALFHGAGHWGDGGWRVVDVWEDESAFDTFAREQIGPLAAKHGIGEPKVERIAVEDVQRGPASDPRLLQIVRLPFGAEGFHAMDDQVRPGGEQPGEMVHHANGPGGDGNWVVVDSWTSREARDTFIGERVRPIMPEGAPEPQFEDLELHNHLI
jgi:hypothetical protein